MSKAKNIPTPWKVYDFGGVQIGHADTGEAVCSMWGNADEGKANAAFIVRAANSHDKLVEALKAARAQIAFWKATADAADGKANSMLFIEPSSYALAEIDAALASLDQESGQ